MRIFVTRASESPASTVVQYSTTANSSANNKNLIPGEESAPGSADFSGCYFTQEIPVKVCLQTSI